MAKREIKVAGKPKQEKIVKSYKDVSLDAQARLAEVMNDSPHIVDLNGTEWEIRALRMGTQWLISEKCLKIIKAEGATFGDILKQFQTNIPSLVEILVLALLNDKNKIYKDGNEHGGYSDLYYATYDTLMWECKVETFGMIFFEVLQLIDVSFFMESHRILEIFREATMTRKTKTLEQK
jgi:hypothetical protein